ncbi:MAG: alpha-rhamnosidase, partial [Mucilaginibacter sp.]|nr:alpha-rhamnosidase [Mucilaginibacter sp.]
SLNHIMFGDIGAWLYRGIGGIKPDELHGGFKNVLLQPNFVAGLNQYEAQHKGPYGNIISSWKRNSEAVEYSVTIPANTTADIRFPVSDAKKVYLNGKVIAANYHIEAGNYKFEIK